MVPGRGRYALFLGTATGVAKTCRMLQDEHAEAEADRDAAIGYKESQGRDSPSARPGPERVVDTAAPQAISERLGVTGRLTAPRRLASVVGAQLFVEHRNDFAGVA